MSKQETGKVAGVTLAKVDEDVIDSYLTKFKLNLPAKAKLADKVKALAEHQKKTPSNHLADCDHCGGDSDVRLASCPFCGIGDDPKEQPKGDKGKAAKPDKGKGKPEKPKPAKPEKPKPAPKIEVVKPSEGEVALNSGIAKVNELRAKGAMCMWELGQAIFDIYSKRLYTQRLTKDGHARYKNWSQFCSVELQMSATQSYKLMDISQLFKRKDVEEIGTAKLGIMVQLPDKERAKLLDKARKEGMTTSAVAKEVRELAAGKKPRDTGRTGFKGGSDASAKGRKAAAAKKKANEVTVATQLGRVTIPLYQRPKGRAAKDAQPKRATTLAQDPFGSEQMVNGIVTHYRIVKQSKGLAIIVERVREEPAK